MKVEMTPPKLLVIAADKGAAVDAADFLNENGFKNHTAIPGRGTAPTELSALLGLGESEKTVIMLATPAERVAEIFEGLRGIGIGAGKGIAVTVPLNSLSNLKVLKMIVTAD